MTVTYGRPPGALASTLDELPFTSTLPVTSISVLYADGSWDAVYGNTDSNRRNGVFSAAYEASTHEPSYLSWTIRRKTPWPKGFKLVVDEEPPAGIAGDFPVFGGNINGHQYFLGNSVGPHFSTVPLALAFLFYPTQQSQSGMAGIVCNSTSGSGSRAWMIGQNVVCERSTGSGTYSKTRAVTADDVGKLHLIITTASATEHSMYWNGVRVGDPVAVSGAMGAGNPPGRVGYWSPGVALTAAMVGAFMITPRYMSEAEALTYTQKVKTSGTLVLPGFDVAEMVWHPPHTGAVGQTLPITTRSTLANQATRNGTNVLTVSTVPAAQVAF